MPASRLRRSAFVVCGVVLAAVATFAGLIVAFQFDFGHEGPRASYAAPKSALEAQRQDLDYFAKAMALDHAFSPAARSKAEARIRALESSSDALPSPTLHVELMQLMALADNGHSRLEAANGRTLFLPLRVTHFADGFYIMRSSAAYTDMLGGRVESIDGQSVDRILARLETLQGGVEVFRQQKAAQFMIVQDLLYGLGISGNPNASTWTVTLPDGQVVTHPLEARPLPQGFDLPSGDRWLSPEPTEGTEHDWIAYRPRSGDVPETWRDFSSHFRLFRPPGSCAQVVRLQSIADKDGQKISPFLTSTEAALRASPPCAVILDLRGDGGGDYTNTWHFSHVLPHLLAPAGRIFVLTDSGTFSAAITTAAFVKDAGRDRVTIIGQPIGDRLSFFSEGLKACLPNLKVCVHYARLKHDYGHPCTDFRECYWLNWLYPVRVTTLHPDIVVPITFADWNAGRDAAYSAALDLARVTPGVNQSNHGLPPGG